MSSDGDPDGEHGPAGRPRLGDAPELPVLCGHRERQHLVSHIVCYHLAMGIRNYLIEGVSGTGKTSICKELRRHGYHAINGDNELANQGDPETGKLLDGGGHEHHIWHVDKVKAVARATARHAVALLREWSLVVTVRCAPVRNFLLLGTVCILWPCDDHCERRIGQ